MSQSSTDEYLRHLQESLHHLHYDSPEATFTDASRLLQTILTLTPRVRPHNLPACPTPVDLVVLEGTIPIFHLGGVRQIPVSIHLLQQFPSVGPLFFVRPSINMSLNVPYFPSPGSSIQLSPNGRVSYTWNTEGPMRSSLFDLVNVVSMEFGVNPPVVKKKTQQADLPRSTAAEEATMAQGSATSASMIRGFARSLDYDSPKELVEDAVELLSSPRYRFAVKVCETDFDDPDTEEVEEDRLIVLKGHVPFVFRSAQYWARVKIYLRKTHPDHAPLVFVCPGTATMVKPKHQHVGSRTGRVYHPSLTGWNHRKGSKLLVLVRTLSEVFGKQPPLVNRQ